MEAEPRVIGHLEKWQAYAADRSIEKRNELVLLHSHVAMRLAMRLSKRIPDQVGLAELVSAAMEGLIDSVERYEVDRGLQFHTYAPRRIWGAMRDYLRSVDFVPRLVRSGEQRAAQARARFASERGYMPSLEELQERPELADMTLLQFRAATQVVQCKSLDTPDRTLDTGDEIALKYCLEDSREVEPRDQAELKERVWGLLRSSKGGAVPDVAPWKRRALARCDTDVDGALAALIIDLRAHDRQAALDARDQLSFALFHRRFRSPAEVRDFILSFPQGDACACYDPSNSPGGTARAA